MIFLSNYNWSELFYTRNNPIQIAKTYCFGFLLLLSQMSVSGIPWKGDFETVNHVGKIMFCLEISQTAASKCLMNDCVCVTTTLFFF